MIEVLTERVPGKVYILMATPPGPAGDFIEVEDAAGRSISLGRWVQIANMFALEIADPRAGGG